jgi:hypothetical protein
VQEGQILARSAGIDWSTGDRLHCEPLDTSPTDFLERYGCTRTPRNDRSCSGNWAYYRSGSTAFDDHLRTHGINNRVSTVLSLFCFCNIQCALVVLVLTYCCMCVVERSECSVSYCISYGITNRVSSVYCYYCLCYAKYSDVLWYGVTVYVYMSYEV